MTVDDGEGRGVDVPKRHLDVGHLDEVIIAVVPGVAGVILEVLETIPRLHHGLLGGALLTSVG